MNETTLFEAESGDKLATLVGSTFARGDGGFGGPSEGQPEPHQVPDRKPDLSLDFPTLPNQALLYRLSGDRNPLHSDPAFAKRVGFPRPILHGLCTYGITCRAVLQSYAEYDPAKFKSHAARFSSPVFPGETITVDLWQDGKIISFEARVKDRGVTTCLQEQSRKTDPQPKIETILKFPRRRLEKKHQSKHQSKHQPAHQPKHQYFENLGFGRHQPKHQKN